MIKAIILDVDGVMLGDKENVNFPHPNPTVIAKLKEINRNYIPISLCTSRPGYAIKEIIEKAELNNLHIAVGGSVVIDPVKNKVVSALPINLELAEKIIKFYINQGTYVEFDTAFEHLIWNKQKNEFTEKNAKILLKPAKIIEDIAQTLKIETIAKIVLIAKDEHEKRMITTTFEQKFGQDVSLHWTIQPSTLPYQYGMITPKGISKKKGAEEIARHTGINLQETLGVGDTMQDWSFLQKCGYAATLANGSQELKDHIKTKVNHFISPYSVDEHGLLDIFSHFSL